MIAVRRELPDRGGAPRQRRRPGSLSTHSQPATPAQASSRKEIKQGSHVSPSRTCANSLTRSSARGSRGPARDHLGEMPRYLEAVRRRLALLPGDAPALMPTVRLSSDASSPGALALAPQRAVEADDSLDEVRWMIEELRVSLWAQALGTPYPVSEGRIGRIIDAARPERTPLPGR